MAAVPQRESTIPNQGGCLGPGRSTAAQGSRHAISVNSHRVGAARFPAGMREAVFGMGCFLGWRSASFLGSCRASLPSTRRRLCRRASLPIPPYEEVFCTGQTGHGRSGAPLLYDPAEKV